MAVEQLHTTKQEFCKVTNIHSLLIFREADEDVKKPKKKRKLEEYLSGVEHLLKCFLFLRVELTEQSDKKLKMKRKIEG